MRPKSKFINAKIVDDKSKDSNNAKKIIITYEEERKNGLYHHIVSIPVFFNDNAFIDTISSLTSAKPKEAFIDLGFAGIRISSGNKIEVEDILIAEQVEELTIEDIEKRFGHKIKIVNNKG